MVQVFPAVILGLFTRWFSAWALLAGWAVGIVLGTMLSAGAAAWVPVHAIWGGIAAYNGITALVANFAVAVVLSALLPNAARDETREEDYDDLRIAVPAE